MRRLQKNIIELEKELMVKNNKIYALEMNALKSAKNNINLNVNNKSLAYRQENGANGTNSSKANQNVSSRYEKNEERPSSTAAKVMKQFTLKYK
jgi:hypothetical protein